MGVAADQLDPLIGAALAVRFEPLIPAGRLILRRVSRRDLLPARYAPRTITSAYRAWVSGLASALASWYC
jgi:hypothetical protein